MTGRLATVAIWYLLLILWWVGSVLGFMAAGVLWRVAHREIGQINHTPGLDGGLLVAARRFRRTARVRFVFSLAFMAVVPVMLLAGQPPAEPGVCVRSPLPPWFSLVIVGSFVYVVWAQAVASALDFRDRKRLLHG